MDTEVVDDDQAGRVVGLRRRLGLVVGLLVLAAGGIATFSLVTSRLTFPYEGPGEPVRPGDTVELRAPGETCGPLVVSLHTPSILGQWNQTHSRDVVDDVFARDEKAWWSWSSSSYWTPVPCASGGAITFTLPPYVMSDVVAACDTDHRCAKVRVDHKPG